MKKLLIIFLGLVLGSCGPTVKVTYDYDKTVDFSKFKTYAYTEEALKLPIQELNRNRLMAAIDKELSARGLSKSPNPDVWIDLQVRAQERKEATATNTGGGYGYGRGYGYGGGFSTTHINVETYVDGTLFINVVSQDKLVWQGRGTKTLDENATPQRREENINYGVAQIFKKYPIQPPAK